MKTKFFFFIFLSLFVTNASALTTEEAKDIGQELEKVYDPLAKSAGVKFELSWLLDQTHVGAYGGPGSTGWSINVWGGLIDHPMMTADAFRMILCHEVGHSIGGKPMAKIGRFDTSMSGQPDYYASSVCMKLLLQNSPYAPSSEHPVIQSACGKKFKTWDEQQLCQRIGIAGLEAALFLYDVTNDVLPRPESPDHSVAQTINLTHPNSQCRFDTFFAGALCDYRPKGKVVNEIDEVHKACENDPLTKRPLCWFVKDH